MPKMPALRAFVDQIDEGMATLRLGPDESVSVTLPLAWLPAGIREGQVLRLDCSLDADASAAARASTKKLMDSLGNEP